MKKIRYERPGLIDLSGDLPTGRAAECSGGYSAARWGDCLPGSCVSNAWCCDGSYTGYCWSNGSTACSKTGSGCKSCCVNGNVPDFGNCYCYNGWSTAKDCGNGDGAVTYCDTGNGASGYLYCEATGGCASGTYG